MRSDPIPTVFGIPLWTAASLGIAAISGIVYGLMQFDRIRLFMNPVIHDVGEFFGLTEDNGIDTKNITHDRIYNSTIRS